jgi:putative transposase
LSNQLPRWRPTLLDTGEKELHYYYRAIDNRGRLVATTYSKVRDLETAEAFFNKAVETIVHKPEKVTTDFEVCYPKAINKVLGRTVEHLTIRYLNNRLEQDHRGVVRKELSVIHC